MTLEELKKRATASEAVLIERVEDLVTKSIVAPDYRKTIINALETVAPVDHFRGSTMRSAYREWLDAVIVKIQETEL